MKIAVILPAAGVGARFSAAPGSASKLEQDLGGRPVFLRAVELFVGRPDVGCIIVAADPKRIDDFKFRWGDALGFHGVKIVPGGTRDRWETVLKALAAVEDCSHVAVHDAVRPLATRALVDRVFEAARSFSAVIPGLPVSATLKRVTDETEGRADLDPLDAILGDAGKPGVAVRRVTETLDRTDVIEVQTPQVFDLGLLRRAYEPLRAGQLDGAGITDDASLVEALGDPAHPVRVVEGEVTNLKITRADDLKLAEAIWATLHQEDQKELAKKRLFSDDDE